MSRLPTRDIIVVPVDARWWRGVVHPAAYAGITAGVLWLARIGIAVSRSPTVDAVVSLRPELLTALLLVLVGLSLISPARLTRFSLVLLIVQTAVLATLPFIVFRAEVG